MRSRHVNRDYKRNKGCKKISYSAVILEGYEFDYLSSELVVNNIHHLWHTHDTDLQN